MAISGFKHFPPAVYIEMLLLLELYKALMWILIWGAINCYLLRQVPLMSLFLATKKTLGLPLGSSQRSVSSQRYVVFYLCVWRNLSVFLLNLISSSNGRFFSIYLSDALLFNPQNRWSQTPSNGYPLIVLLVYFSPVFLSVSCIVPSRWCVSSLRVPS